MTAGELLAELAGVLPRHEARILLEEVTGSRPGELALRSHAPLDPEAVSRARRLAARRLGGEPLQYVVGHWAFRTLELAVDPRALIPRPETELVVDVALGELDALTAGRPDAIVVDLGTGTGAIALSVAAERPGARVVAVERSPAARALARENLAAYPHLAERVEVVTGDWYSGLSEALAGKVDLVIANPPYLSAAEWSEAAPVVREHEPAEALVADENGTSELRTIVAGAPRWLARPGVLCVEIGASQGALAAELAQRASARTLEVRPDLLGRDRVLVARW